MVLVLQLILLQGLLALQRETVMLDNTAINDTESAPFSKRLGNFVFLKFSVHMGLFVMQTLSLSLVLV